MTARDDYPMLAKVAERWSTPEYGTELSRGARRDRPATAVHERRTRRDRNVTHIVATPGARHSLCGVRDPLPRVWVPFVAMHVRQRGMVVCPDCANPPR